jgi:hypothetical protein
MKKEIEIFILFVFKTQLYNLKNKYSKLHKNNNHLIICKFQIAYHQKFYHFKIYKLNKK